MDNLQFVYKPNRNDDITQLLNKLSSKKIIFGHQSVGYNILKGIIQLEEESGMKLNIIESKEFSEIESPSLIHFLVGKNKDAVSKIDDFVKVMDDIAIDNETIAFFKFCYIDIRKTDDINSIFQYYKSKMLYLKNKYPHIKVFLVTVPYRALQKGPKAIIKKILFKPVGEVLNNINRAKFNEMILNELGDEFPIFDLGKVESTLPNGTLKTFKWKGKQYPCMPYIYTYDGGHLNKVGEKVVAHNLINFLYNQIN